MTRIRPLLLAFAFAVTAMSVTYGVSLMHEPAAFIIGGLLFGGWAYLVLAK